ncbi:50S ribosomal protein L13 [Virgibacillus sp. W0430]|uniref:50S ribosomal protein L13 n=1 Tax=Virgibacillus sp. W0430 TaxID=3391580 RepID=UPI003F469D77
MRTTFMANENNIERKWLVVDAEGERLGRLASEVASILRGKHKPTYTPHADTGDHVIIVNAEKIELTGNKLSDKKYYRHSGYPGGLKERSAAEMRTNYSERMIELAIKGMLPKGPLGRKMIKKLHVYRGPEHKNQAQKPEAYELRG